MSIPMLPKELTQQLQSLNKAQLLAARMLADELLERAQEVEENAQTEADSASPAPAKGKKDGKGWVELKMINGSGPYAYRRWYEGKRCRSKYIGKVKQEG